MISFNRSCIDLNESVWSIIKLLNTISTMLGINILIFSTLYSPTWQCAYIKDYRNWTLFPYKSFFCCPIIPARIIENALSEISQVSIISLNTRYLETSLIITRYFCKANAYSLVILYCDKYIRFLWNWTNLGTATKLLERCTSKYSLKANLYMLCSSFELKWGFFICS